MIGGKLKAAAVLAADGEGWWLMAGGEGRVIPAMPRAALV